MKEIRFRAKMLDSDDFVYGYYIHSELQNEIFKHKIYCAEVNRLADVKEETVGQYAGLKDKNGKEIYEGDIIEWTTLSGRKNRFSIEYSNKYAQYIIVNTGDALMEYEPLGDYENIEVIGNIYDNPKLLEKESD